MASKTVRAIAFVLRCSGAANCRLRAGVLPGAAGTLGRDVGNDCLARTVARDALVPDGTHSRHTAWDRRHRRSERDRLTHCNLHCRADGDCSGDLCVGRARASKASSCDVDLPDHSTDCPTVGPNAPRRTASRQRSHPRSSGWVDISLVRRSRRGRWPTRDPICAVALRRTTDVGNLSISSELSVSRVTRCPHCPIGQVHR